NTLVARERSSNRIANRTAALDAFSQFAPEYVIDAIIAELDDVDDVVADLAEKLLISLGALALPRLVAYYVLNPSIRLLEVMTEMREYLEPYMQVVYFSSNKYVRDRIKELAQNLKEKGVAISLIETINSNPQPVSRDLRKFWSEFESTYNPHTRYLMLRSAKSSTEFLNTVILHLNQAGYPYREELIKVFIEIIAKFKAQRVKSLLRSAPEGLRAAIARSVPYLDGNLGQTMFRRLSADTSWFVRKELLSSYIFQPEAKLNAAQIRKISFMLQDGNWLCRYLAASILLNRRKINISLLDKALHNSNWEIITTAIRAISVLTLKQAAKRWGYALSQYHDSIITLAKTDIKKRGIAALPYLIKMAGQSDPWTRMRSIQLIGEISIPQKDLKNIITALSSVLSKEPYGFVRAAIYYSLSSLLHYFSEEAVLHNKVVSLLKTALDSEKIITARWAIIEGLGIIEPEVYRKESLSFKEEFTKKFIKTIDDFNASLKKNGHSGRIEKIIFEDSSFSKPHSLFLIASDLDAFRIIYSGKIPQSLRKTLRNYLWDLMVFIKPVEPHWFSIEEKESMYKTAVDVLAYSRNGKPKRTIINDLLEEKPLRREHVFKLINQGIIKDGELGLFRKINRNLSLTTLYGFDTKLRLKDKKELIDLAYLAQKDCVSVMIDIYGNAFIRGKWATYTGKELQVFVGNNPLRYLDFILVYRMAENDISHRHYVDYPRQSAFSAGKQRLFASYYKKNNENYQQVSEGKKPGFDYLILTARDEKQKEYYEKMVEALRKDGLIHESLKVRVYSYSDNYVDGNGYMTCYSMAKLGEELYSAAAIRHKTTSDVFKGKRILLIHSGGQSVRNPFNSVIGKAFATFGRDSRANLTTPIMVDILKSLSGIPEKMTGDGGLLIAAADTVLLFDANNVATLAGGPAGFGFSGDITQAIEHGFYLNRFLRPDVVASLEHYVDLSTLMKRGLLNRSEKSFRVRNVDTDMIFFSHNNAAAFAEILGFDVKDGKLIKTQGVFASLQKPFLISLYQGILHAFLWDKIRYLSFAKDSHERKIYSQIWEKLHSKSNFRLNYLEPCYKFDTGTLISTQEEVTGLRLPDGIYPLAKDPVLTKISGQVIDPQASLYDSDIKGEKVILGKHSLIEESKVSNGIEIGRGSHIKGLWGIQKYIKVPQHSAFYQLPLVIDGKQHEIITFYGISDSGKAKKLFGEDISIWLSQRGLSAEDIWDKNITTDSRTLWNARLFTVDDASLEMTLALYPNKIKEFEALREEWIKARRFSLEEISYHANYNTIFNRQMSLRRRPLTVDSLQPSVTVSKTLAMNALASSSVESIIIDGAQ
ncbi:MAG: L-fucokinase, partial [Candidatus Omnitrophota bacterium]